MGERDRFDEIGRKSAAYLEEWPQDVEIHVARVARGAHNAALEEVACKADHHARFCRYEADNGGSPDLYERASGANYLAEQARNLKVTSHD